VLPCSTPTQYRGERGRVRSDTAVQQSCKRVGSKGPGYFGVVTTESISAGHRELPPPFGVSVKLAADAVVIEVAGALDGRAQRWLEASFASARNAERRGVVVDLSGLLSCDELAAQVLADEVRACLDGGCHVEIAGKGDRAASSLRNPTGDPPGSEPVR
jgi:hypothetical protein